MLVEMEKKNINTLFDDVSAKALAEGIVGTGELMVFTGGTPLGTTGTTNTIKVGLVGDILLQGKSAVKGNKVTSHTNIITSSEEAKLHFRKGDIFVTSNPDKGLIPYMMRAAALVVGSKNNDDFTHAVDLGRELKIPVLVCDGTQVSSVVPDNLLATIDSNKGTLSNGDK